MLVGYVRVSTEDQNTARQETLMRQLGVDKIYIDKATGKDTNREQLLKMLDYVRDGDVVVVESYSRLARSTRDLLDILETLRKKEAGFISRKENIDTSTPQGRLMLTVFAGLYQFERECLLERQAEGIAEAKKAGKYKGRKPIVVDKVFFVALYERWKKGAITAAAFYRQLNLSPSTFYRKVKMYENSLKDKSPLGRNPESRAGSFGDP